jgi:hypothetical protein
VAGNCTEITKEINQKSSWLTAMSFIATSDLRLVLRMAHYPASVAGSSSASQVQTRHGALPQGLCPTVLGQPGSANAATLQAEEARNSGVVAFEMHCSSF